MRFLFVAEPSGQEKRTEAGAWRGCCTGTGSGYRHGFGDSVSVLKRLGGSRLDLDVCANLARTASARFHSLAEDWFARRHDLVPGDDSGNLHGRQRDGAAFRRSHQSQPRIDGARRLQHDQCPIGRRSLYGSQFPQYCELGGRGAWHSGCLGRLDGHRNFTDDTQWLAADFVRRPGGGDLAAAMLSHGRA